jgi:hypothetical protein
MKFSTSVEAATSITFYIHAVAEGGASLVQGPFVLNIVCGPPSNPPSFTTPQTINAPVFDSAGKNTYQFNEQFGGCPIQTLEIVPVSGGTYTN